MVHKSPVPPQKNASCKWHAHQSKTCADGMQIAGSMAVSPGRNARADVVTQNAMWAAFAKLRPVWACRAVGARAKVKILQTLVLPLLRWSAGLHDVTPTQCKRWTQLHVRVVTAALRRRLRPHEQLPDFLKRTRREAREKITASRVMPWGTCLALDYWQQGRRATGLQNNELVAQQARWRDWWWQRAHAHMDVAGRYGPMTRIGRPCRWEQHLQLWWDQSNTPWWAVTCEKWDQSRAGFLENCTGFRVTT